MRRAEAGPAPARQGRRLLFLLLPLSLVVGAFFVLHASLRSPRRGPPPAPQRAAAARPSPPAPAPAAGACGREVHRGCLGAAELAELARYPRAWYTGCRPADHSPRPYDGRLLDENYRTALPHIAFHYEPLSNTGHGIFGAVVIAVDHSTCEKVAVKLSKQGRADDKHSQEHELHIMETLQRLPAYSEQGLPHLVDHGTFRGATYLAYEVLGIQIHKLLVTGGQCSFGFKLPFVKAFAERLLRALDFIHRHGISHNDMYYHNLLLKDYSPDHVLPDSVTLIDFGRATERADWGRRADPGKTPYYAPELALQTRDWGPGSDLWSFGALLLFLRTAKNVFVPGYKQDWRARAVRIGRVLGQEMPLAVANRSHFRGQLLTPAGRLAEEFRVNASEYRGVCAFFAERCNPEDAEDRAFAAFAAQFLAWEPAARPTAAAALAAPFLRTGRGPPAVYRLCAPRDAAADAACACNPPPPRPYPWRRPGVQTFHTARTYDAGV